MRSDVRERGGGKQKGKINRITRKEGEKGEEKVRSQIFTDGMRGERVGWFSGGKQALGSGGGGNKPKVGPRIKRGKEIGKRGKAKERTTAGVHAGRLQNAING